MHQEISGAIECDAPCCDEETPKVQARIFFERSENRGSEFEDIVEGDTNEDGDHKHDNDPFLVEWFEGVDECHGCWLSLTRP